MTHYKVNRPDVVCEVFEDEVVVVNLGSGTYYSLGGTAADVWNHLEKGISPDAIVESLAQVHRRANEEIQPDIQHFLTRLIEEKLIVPDPSGSNGHVPSINRPGHPGTYTAPSLESYTDMQELLLLDPIHDVDETGWPAARPPQASVE